LQRVSSAGAHCPALLLGLLFIEKKKDMLEILNHLDSPVRTSSLTRHSRGSARPLNELKALNLSAASVKSLQKAKGWDLTFPTTDAHAWRCQCVVSAGTQFTCFTGTKVQNLSERGCLLGDECSWRCECSKEVCGGPDS
jgi:hypothetical protein